MEKYNTCLKQLPLILSKTSNKHSFTMRFSEMSYIFSRPNVIKLLNKLPTWIFPQTPRIIINPMIVQTNSQFQAENCFNMSDSNNETDSECDEDSACDLSFNTSYFENSNESIDMNEKKRKKCRRMSNQWLVAASKKYTELEEQIRLLREELGRLLLQIDGNQKEDTNVNENTDSVQCSAIPTPPPLPQQNIFEKLQSVKNEIKPSFILTDITNIRLKPIDWSTPKRESTIYLEKMKNVKQRDVRLHLLEMLKKRYSVMHSPMKKHASDLSASLDIEFDA